jgi:hypothetical protein
MMLAFGLYHIRLIWRNTTTNETFKWRDIHAYQIKCRKILNSNPLDPADVTLEVKYWANRNLTNVYNRGLMANFAEALCPPRISYSASKEKKKKKK